PLLDGELGLFDVPEIGRLLVTDHPQPQVAQRVVGLKLATVLRADFGWRRRLSINRRPRGRGVVGRPAPLALRVHSHYAIVRLVGVGRLDAVAQHRQFAGRGLGDEVRRELRLQLLRHPDADLVGYVAHRKTLLVAAVHAVLHWLLADRVGLPRQG